MDEFSEDSFDEADLEELSVNRAKFSNIEVANRRGQTRNLFKKKKQVKPGQRQF